MRFSFPSFLVSFFLFYATVSTGRRSSRLKKAKKISYVRAETQTTQNAHTHTNTHTQTRDGQGQGCENTFFISLSPSRWLLPIVNEFMDTRVGFFFSGK